MLSRLGRCTSRVFGKFCRYQKVLCELTQSRIPFDRALDFANKEKITELLYPLFVHNIGALLYHPTNQARQSIGNAAMAARGRPDQQQEYMRTPQGTQPPALTHHHSMTNPIGASIPQPPHSIAPHPASGRPGLDRAHTFPTPPTSASSLTMGLGNSGSSYEYGGAQAPSMHSGQPLSIDTGMIVRSVPTTPASTPPANSQVQYQTSQPYDGSRQMYSAPTAYGGYAAHQNMHRYGGVQSSPGVKSEMGPPSRAGAEHEHHESKAHAAYGGQQDAEGEHEGEYTHTSASYDARRPSYNYKPNPAPGPMHPDPSHVSPEMTHSPHQNGSGRATPRSANAYTGYGTPQRTATLPSSNLSYGMSADARPGAPNGPETYPQSAYQPQQPQYPSMNGAPPSNKRMREVDDEQDQYGRPLSAGGDGLKRQRTDPGSRPISQPHSIKTGGPMRR
jgi:protein SOK2